MRIRKRKVNRRIIKQFPSTPISLGGGKTDGAAGFYEEDIDGTMGGGGGDMAGGYGQTQGEDMARASATMITPKGRQALRNIIKKRVIRRR